VRNRQKGVYFRKSISSGRKEVWWGRTNIKSGSRGGKRDLKETFGDKKRGSWGGRSASKNHAGGTERRKVGVGSWIKRQTDFMGGIVKPVRKGESSGSSGKNEMRMRKRQDIGGKKNRSQ